MCNRWVSSGFPCKMGTARGAEGQAPDIRCLTFGPAAGSLEAGATSPGQPLGTRCFLRGIGAEIREAKVKHRISGA